MIAHTSSRMIRRTTSIWGPGCTTSRRNNGRCQDLRDGYGLTRDLYRAAWLKENRPYWLDNVSAQYELAMQLWIQRGIRFAEAQQQWYQTHTLPPPESLGLPAIASAATASPNPPTVVPQ